MRTDMPEPTDFEKKIIAVMACAIADEDNRQTCQPDRWAGYNALAKAAYNALLDRGYDVVDLPVSAAAEVRDG